MRVELTDLGEKLRQRRELLGLGTLTQLADPLGLRLDLILKEPVKTGEQ